MLQITDGQCGRCTHFGSEQSEQVVQIRINGVAPEGFTDACGLPEFNNLKLQVTANSGCEGFVAAA